MDNVNSANEDFDQSEPTGGSMQGEELNSTHKGNSGILETVPEGKHSNRKTQRRSSRDTTPPITPPPLRPEEIDIWHCHTGLQQFGEKLQAAANAAFPNNTGSRYRNIHVLMIKWEDEDPNLPVSYEIARLFDIFDKIYQFKVEVWDIPDDNCHAEVNQKILDFSKLGGNSKDDLKILYYAGHGKLTRNRLLSWTRYGRTSLYSNFPR